MDLSSLVAVLKCISDVRQVILINSIWPGERHQEVAAPQQEVELKVSTNYCIVYSLPYFFYLPGFRIGIPGAAST